MFRIIIPLIVGHTLVSRCPRPQDTTEPMQNSIRELMWPVLLVSMGFAWNAARGAARHSGMQVDGAYALLTAIVMWWMHTHFCTDRSSQAKMILVLAAAVTGVVVYISGAHNPTASIMLLPMLVWLLFAERLEIPKIRIKLPSIKVRLPSVSVGSNGGVSVAVPAPAPEQPTQTTDGVAKASTSTPVPPPPPSSSSSDVPPTTLEGFYYY